MSSRCSEFEQAGFSDVLRAELDLRRSPIHGFGIFALSDLTASQLVGSIRGQILRGIGIMPGKADEWPNSFSLGLNLTIDPLPPFSRINHSCAPNVAMGTRRLIYTLKHISAGAELTIDYSSIELDQHWQMRCRCGAKTCRNVIRALQFTPSALHLAAPALRSAAEKIAERQCP